VLKGGATLAYGYLWWTPPPGPALDDHAYSAVGIYGQRLYVDPAARVVIAQWGARPTPLGGEVVDDWAFDDAVVSALRK
jgi:CubicO group peptidase (beta-lactamase class C family)